MTVDLVSYEGARVNRDAGWDNGLCQASARNHTCNRRKQIFFFTLIGKTLPWRRMPGAHGSFVSENIRKNSG